jgi:hypothetical protein
MNLREEKVRLLASCRFPKHTTGFEVSKIAVEEDDLITCRAKS